jgi:hypothetical protein
VGQVVGWSVVFLGFAVLIAMFFAYDTAARPLFGAALDAQWSPPS